MRLVRAWRARAVWFARLWRSRAALSELFVSTPSPLPPAAWSPCRPFPWKRAQGEPAGRRGPLFVSRREERGGGGGREGASERPGSAVSFYPGAKDVRERRGREDRRWSSTAPCSGDTRSSGSTAASRRYCISQEVSLCQGRLRFEGDSDGRGGSR